MTAIQYRVVVGKKESRVVGPDNADLVIQVDSTVLGVDPNISFMQGKLKVVGHTGLLFDALKSGQIAADLANLAAVGQGS